ncbi:MAG: hypothetical protein V3V16_11490 [Melioribacteraceae bacterium]
MKIKSIILIVVFTFLIACNKDSQIVEPKLSIVGEWNAEYEILSDGTKDYRVQYAILEFNYSDAFILKENKKGHSIWFDNINGDFEWTRDNSKLTITVTQFDSTREDFEFQLSELKNHSMVFDTPKGHKYLLSKK